MANQPSGQVHVFPHLNLQLPPPQYLSAQFAIAVLSVQDALENSQLPSLSSSPRTFCMHVHKDIRQINKHQDQ